MPKSLRVIACVGMLLLVGLSTLWAQPANNTCATATLLTLQDNQCAPQLFSNNLATSVGDPAQPSCWTSAPARTIWFRFQATTAAARLSTNFAQTVPNTRIAVYSGSCGALTLIACNNDINTTDGDLRTASSPET